MVILDPAQIISVSLEGSTVFSQILANGSAAAKRLESKLLKRKHAKLISLPKEKRIKRLRILFAPWLLQACLSYHWFL